MFLKYVCECTSTVKYDVQFSTFGQLEKKINTINMTIIVHLYGDFAVKMLVGILHGKVKKF